MELFENIVEYYDELYPYGEAQKKFYEAESKEFSRPVRHLTIGSGSGSFEHYLAKNGADVTGLETVIPLLESANRKRRTQLMALRFFQMSSLEMCRFLGKHFYNIIFVPNGRIIFTSDPTLMSKFFYDCHTLLSQNGKLIISLPNFEKFNKEPKEVLPVRESIRVKLFTNLKTNSNGEKILNQEIETGNGKHLTVTENAKILPLTKNSIEEFARGAGFSKLSFYSDFNYSEFTNDSDELVVVIS